jgi:hypothetical protein
MRVWWRWQGLPWARGSMPDAQSSSHHRLWWVGEGQKWSNRWHLSHSLQRLVTVVQGMASIGLKWIRMEGWVPVQEGKDKLRIYPYVHMYTDIPLVAAALARQSWRVAVLIVPASSSGAYVHQQVPYAEDVIEMKMVSGAPCAWGDAGCLGTPTNTCAGG